MTFRHTLGLIGKGLRFAAVPVLCTMIAACTTTHTPKNGKTQRSKEYFSESEYGVKASPRVANGKRVPKGGGRYQVGKPYMVKGKWYTPKEDFGYNKSGLASWYGSAFHGRLTANGEVYDSYHLSAAHPTFPLPSYARVTNLENGSSVIVRVNDRGPYAHGRIIDVSSKTAELLDMKRKGTANVRVQYVGRARMDGHDMPYLMASYATKGSRVPQIMPEGQIASGVMVASNEPMALPEESQVADVEQSVLGQGVPVTALAGVETTSAGLQAIDAVFALPQIGPFPVERPNMLMLPNGGASYAAAYAQVRVSDAEDAFEAILAEPSPLTSDAIVAYAKRNRAAK
ncbi:septal ring lytic transglycosylase RlpA family protein [Pararhizobium sp.]|uniref:septal ring lytic transglycosylase RlpA family protein n=1 Tax=Pararhizobium sp. TaxID=1977563 RepID=UPI00271C6967|nr:septal ring lytic transglycosylase RlpA family protein [Pararhizobium sp.]MDO9418571.1 septal ring lytic transglycosylase RlpA family protein [Pararhizobium sp.]